MLINLRLSSNETWGAVFCTQLPGWGRNLQEAADRDPGRSEVKTMHTCMPPSCVWGDANRCSARQLGVDSVDKQGGEATANLHQSLKAKRDYCNPLLAPYVHCTHFWQRWECSFLCGCSGKWNHNRVSFCWGLRVPGQTGSHSCMNTCSVMWRVLRPVSFWLDVGQADVTMMVGPATSGPEPTPGGE